MIRNDQMFFYSDFGDFILAYVRRGASTAISNAGFPRISEEDAEADKRPVRFYMREPLERIFSCMTLPQFWKGSVLETIYYFKNYSNLHWNPITNYKIIATDIRTFDRISELNLSVVNKSDNKQFVIDTVSWNLIVDRWEKDLKLYAKLYWEE